MLILNLAGFKIDKNLELKFKTSVFPGGEVFFRLEGNVIGETVIIATRLNSSESIMRLMMANDALRRAGAASINCFIPYLPYAQQDRVCSAGESHSLKVMSDLINSMKFDLVSVLDPHSNVVEATIDNLVVLDNISFVREVLDDIETGHINLVVPDAGAAKKVDKLLPLFESRGIDVNVVVCSKARNFKDSSITSTVVPVIDNDWDILIVDDLCLAGGTFMKIMDEIDKQKTANSRPLDYKAYLATTHGIYNAGFEKLDEYFDKIYCTNSWQDISNPLVKQFNV